MNVCLDDDEGVALDLSDEQNIEILSYLRDVYDGDGDLRNSYFNIFQLLGIQDWQFIENIMSNISNKRPSYNTQKNCFNDDANTRKLKEYSKIQLDAGYYIKLSDAHVYFHICYYILNCKKYITSKDVCFLLDAIDAIYAKLGELYTEIMLRPTQQIQETRIQSLGGKSRANKYLQYKNEILNTWQNNDYHSYALFAREHADKYNLSTKTIENWLSKKFSNQK